MKVVHALAPAPYGGLESVVRQLAVGQAALDRCAGVIALRGVDDPPSSMVEGLRASGVRVAEVVTGSRAYGRQRAEVRALLADWGPEVLHCHGYHADVVLSGVAKRVGIKVVSTAHGFTRGGWRNRLYEWLQVWHFRKFSGVAAVSRKLREELIAAGVPDGRVALIPNAYRSAEAPLSRAEARESIGIAADAWAIGWVGRLGPEKGGDVFLEAIARLEGRAGLTAVIIGSGRMEESLRARADELGISGSIIWAGRRPDAASLFKAFDLFVLSSRTEGTPMVLLEAMSAGVPVVTTAVGGIPDVVGDEEAWLVPSDDPSALAAAIVAAREDHVAARGRAGAAGRRLEAGYGVPGWLEKYDELYRAAMENTPRD